MELCAHVHIDYTYVHSLTGWEVTAYIFKMHITPYATTHYVGGFWTSTKSSQCCFIFSI